MTSAFEGFDSEGQNGAYRVLARKYRPKDFSDLIGQEPMVRTLSNAFETGRIAQAYMLTGVRGIGKTTTARILARALNYQTDSQDAPNIELAELGAHCTAIMQGRHPDVMEMDAASHTGIDDIRNLIEAAAYAPTSSRYKVFIIDEVHMLSKAAFNGLLKTLEEPPSHVKFIFATTEIRKVPITVLSRCQRFDLRRIDGDMLADHVKKICALEDAEISNEAAALIARAGEGSVRDALSILDQAIALSNTDGKPNVTSEGVRDMLGLADRTRIIELFEKLMNGSLADALADLADQYASGADPATVLADLASFTHFTTRLKFVSEAGADVSVAEFEREKGSEFAQKLSVRVLGRVWQALLKGVSEVNLAKEPLAAAEMVLIRIAHAAELPSPEQAIEQLKHLASNPQTAPSNSAQAQNMGGSGENTNVSTLAPQPNDSAPTMQGENSNLALEIAQTSNETTTPQPSLVVSNSADAISPSSHAQNIDLSAFSTLEALHKLAGDKRDIVLKDALFNDVRLIELKPPSMRFTLSESADTRIVSKLTERLQEWTGTRWMISLEHGEVEETQLSPSLAEQQQAERHQQLADAENDTTVQAVMRAFPGAKLVDVRPKEDEAEGVIETIDETDHIED